MIRMPRGFVGATDQGEEVVRDRDMYLGYVSRFFTITIWCSNNILGYSKADIEPKAGFGVS